MAVSLQPIYTQSVGVAGSGTVSFSNIPQNYTDLMLIVSARSNRGTFMDEAMLTINSGGNTSNTILSAGSSGASSNRTTSTTYLINALSIPGANQTANVFGNMTIYIPNYAGNNYKQIIADNVSEDNGSNWGLGLIAGLYNSTSAITSLSFVPRIATIVQYSTFSLYGILRQGI